MSRPLRIEYAGACYHIINRGNQRSCVFHQSSHYKLFLNKLVRFANQFNVRIFCYCFMPNHFHIYIKTEEANLSRFMQSFLGSFSITMNNIRHSSGHIFQGRFKAQLVEDDVYSTWLSRYIHLNPVKTTKMNKLPVAEKRKVLRSYEWSSYGYYTGIKTPPQWLDRSTVLASIGTGRGIKNQLSEYRRYVERDLCSVNSKLEEFTSGVILGSDDFVEDIRNKYLYSREADRREEPELVKLKGGLTFDRFLGVSGKLLDISTDVLLSREGGHRLPRRTLMYCAAKYCRETMSLSSISERFGISVSGLAISNKRFEKEIQKDKKLRKRVIKIERELKKVKCVGVTP